MHCKVLNFASIVDSSNLQMVQASRAQDVASVPVKCLHLLNVFVLDVAEAAGTGDAMNQNGICDNMNVIYLMYGIQCRFMQWL